MADIGDGAVVKCIGPADRRALTSNGPAQLAISVYRVRGVAF